MRLPELNLVPAPEHQRAGLARWLAAWEIDRQLCAPAGLGNADIRPAGAGTGPSARPTHGEPAPRVGQLRLLAPGIRVARDRLVYVALLADGGPGRYLCAPFSRFSEPAFPGEWLSGREEPCLRVLCLWNARRLPAHLLARSWVVGRSTLEELGNAMAVYEHVSLRTRLSPGLCARVGPPAWHPADPRVEYRRQESLLMDALAQEPESRSNGRSDNGNLLYPPSDQARLRAADPRNNYPGNPGPDGNRDTDKT